MVRFRLLLLGVVLSLVVPASATARVFHTVLEDDALSLFSPATLPQFTAELRWLGVDELRVSAEWKSEAPDPTATVRPPGFDAADPASYDSSTGMRLLDHAVRAAAKAGLGVIVDPAYSAPLWATSNRPPRLPGGDPWFNRNIDVGELAQWEGMLARRYNGTYVPAGASTSLPRVRTFTLWNEPNEQGYLAPQWRGGEPVSADWYRSVVRAAVPAIERANPGATVLLGNTSAVGGDAEAGNGGVPPLTFLRRLACVDDQLHPITTGSCAGFTELPGDGWAQHPYERDAPPWVDPGQRSPGSAMMGNLDGLQTLLDRLVAMHRIAPGVATLWLTEQGYESNAQLTDRPWTEPEQAELNAVAEELAWRDPQLVSFAQFLLRDTLTAQATALRARTGFPHAQPAGTWTTGLERENGAPKLALAMFRSPVAARIVSHAPAAAWLPSSPAGAPAELLDVWGRARPIHSPTLVLVQVSDDGSGIYRDAGQTTTDGNGVFGVRIAIAAGVPSSVRFQWLAPDGTWQVSPGAEPLSF